MQQVYAPRTGWREGGREGRVSVVADGDVDTTGVNAQDWREEGVSESMDG